MMQPRRSGEEFRMLLESAPDAMVIVDHDGRIVLVNAQTEKLFGYARTELLGEHIEKLIPQRYRDKHVGHRKPYVAEPRPRAMGAGLELRGLRNDGTEFQVEISLSPLQTAQGTLVSSAIRDVTERERVAHELREHQNLLDHAQALAHLGYWSWDVALNKVNWSEELYRIYGIEARDHHASLEGYLECVHPEDRAATRQAIESALKEGSRFRTEERIVRADGEVRHLLSYGETMTNASGHPIRMIGTCLDVTDQKRTEMALHEAAAQLRMLSRRLVDAQELERRRLAAELHDRVGQNLTVLGINLAIVARSIQGAHEDLRHRLQDSSMLVESTTACIEGVLDELRPPMLEDWALDSVLRWYAEVFSRRTEIAVKMNSQGALRRLGSARETALFRITQEALNNVAKHAQARNVRIVLEWREDSVSLEIADEGVGFDAAARDASGGLGMITMRERVEAIGGQMDIDAAPGAGTRVRVMLPC